MNDVVAFFAIIGTFMLYDTFQTLVNTAYSTMTAELTTDYDERTGLATTRMLFNVIGYIFGAAVTTILAAVFQDSLGLSLRTSWSLVGLVFGLLAAGTLMIPAFSKDLKPVVEQEPSAMPALKSLLSTFKNKPFVKFVVITSIMSTAFTLVTAMLPYFIKYQIQMESSGSIIMLLLLLTLAIFLIPCKQVADKIGKAKTYALGITIASVALIVAFALPHRASGIIFGVAIVAGLGFSSQWICPHSMMPDVIEYDELMTGKRREGLYYGMWNMTGKITGALGSAMCGWGLAIFGYVENVEQTDLSRLGIRLLFTLIPAFLLLVCVPLLIRYPITKKTHADVMRQIAEKKAAAEQA
ncbi:MAG: hypothetical protein A2Y16_06055 [Tenericutes bacterium GWF2_57_13]|nr:MAG: hypothetical protein A2Y16_06055 [Tenericutes bacterium GWF2_57_13]